MVYLDNAATSFVKPQSVYYAVSRAMFELSSPGRGGYETAMRAAETAFLCREAAAALFNVPGPENVVITFNATHGLNIAIRSLASRGGRVVVSGFEHNSVMRPLNDIGARTFVAAAQPFDENSTLNAFHKKLTPDTELAVVNHVSNVFGCIQPVYEIAEMCRKRHIPLIIDASQSAGVLSVDFMQLGAAFVAMPGHKGLFGPQGTGLLLCGEMPRTFMAGGTGSSSILHSMPDVLPDRAEAGTHNMPGIAGLLAGIKFVSSRGTDIILKHERELIALLSQELNRIEKVKTYMPPVYNGTGVLSFNINDIAPEAAARSLSELGIAVRAGLHCAPLAHKSAGTLETGTIRSSVSVLNTRRDIKALVRAVIRIAERH